ncbi:NAD-dependent 4,6-dehydratase LegB [Alicyclobacillus sp. SO9]|uniref:NAD-dependent 4,6-dehydratase LegB n=1 Tax=Alicyclobacillus sp. SO9 TaxID=2665646 RepID=UPI0018E89FD1|nr:NAD-dependent 4,6-dehydratase LegB [Alicyclobacillus sp. SO9]QQE78265.1 SDR family NAD(P)-dependent oxidoreductase [Alicyclobacillus sp. SO9]
MHLKGKRVLVTGADGFIGSHLVEELVQTGCDVKAFAWYNSFGSAGWLDSLDESVRNEVDVVLGDIRDASAVKSALSQRDVVFHLAALIGIPYSYVAPESYVDTNIRGTLNVLQAVRELELEKMIHTSTSEVYGTARFVPITEDHPLQPQSPYSATKMSADELALSFYYSFQTPVAVIRPFNTYGPRQSLRAVIPTVITQIAQGAKTLRLGSLHPRRDFNYVRDTVLGFTAMAASEQSVGEVVNIGSGFDVSIGETAQLIADIMGAAVEIQTDAQRIRPKDSEVERLLADNQKAQRLLGWKPQLSGEEGLRQGLTQTIAWFCTAENLKRFTPQVYTI